MNISSIIITFSIICLSGCATTALAHSNREYKKENRVPIVAKSGRIDVKVFTKKAGEQAYKVSTSIGDCYIVIADNYKVTIRDSIPEDYKFMEDGDIILMDREEFAKSDTLFRANEHGTELFVVGDFSKDEMGVLIDSKVSIYAKWGTRMRMWERIESELPIKTAAKFGVAARGLGYFVTVPVDIVTAPLFVAIILVAGAGNGLDM